ncbi:MAG TPA: ScpA family protein [Candidatus Dormibacteraeota bacterium]|jgi:segregation and condensation protein A|nr:ScpA family protein [Candidatus Dormibacteraeota bacterium]
MDPTESPRPEAATVEAERDPIYLVRSPAFDGPIELLLSLAQRSEVDLKAIPLASLTDDYLRAIEENRPPIDRLAAFLVIGARLVQLKAAALMPVAAESEQEDLQAWEDAIKGRLEEYKRFKELAESLMRRHASGRFTFAGLLEPEVIPQARVQVSLDALAAAFQQVLDRLPPADQVSIEFEQVSLADKLEELRRMLMPQRELNFSAIFRHARTRLEAVVTFLALLELIRIGEARVAQASAFGEIMVHGEERKQSD